jgi:hypothetical protein
VDHGGLLSGEEKLKIALPRIVISVYAEAGEFNQESNPLM